MTRPLPTAPGTVIDVVVTEDDGHVWRERYVRLKDDDESDAKWLSLEDRTRCIISDDTPYQLVAQSPIETLAELAPALRVLLEEWAEVQHAARNA